MVDSGGVGRQTVLLLLVLAVVGFGGVATAVETGGVTADNDAVVSENVDSSGPFDASDGNRSEDDSGVTVLVRPTAERVSVGSTVTFEVVVRGAGRGISTYQFDIGLNSSAASFVEFEPTLPDIPLGSQLPLSKSEIRDNTTLSLETALMDAVHDPTDEVVIAEATVEVARTGVVSATPGTGTGDDPRFVIGIDNKRYDVTWTSGRVEGVDLPSLAAGPPRDLDGDGIHEDVRGDGETNVFDVQALFSNLDNPEVQTHAELFDFQGDSPDAVTVFDVQALFDDIE